MDSTALITSHPKQSSTSTDLLGTPFQHLCQLLDDWGVGRVQAKRIFRGLHVHRLPLHQIPSLGRHATTVASHTRIATAEIIEVVSAQDGTKKILLQLSDGARVEAVLLPMRRERFTLCVSTQVGCAMGCSFCATGTMGLTRPLSAGEIVAQVYRAQEYVNAQVAIGHSERTLSHLVFMGMGEPLHYYDQTRDALRVLLDQHGICLAARHVTVSTVGLVHAMRRFSSDFGGRVQLALSLHAGTDETRRQIIPAARKWSLSELKKTLIDHPLPGSRVLMLEYVILPGVNDTPAELDGVAEFSRGLRALVNLIPFNPFKGSDLRSPTRSEIDHVEVELKRRGVPCSVRVTRGQERAGACGQLAMQGFQS